jgi:hypothetical protein
MKTVTETIVVADHQLLSVDPLPDLAQAPKLYGPFTDDHLPEIWHVIRDNAMDNIVFRAADGGVYVLEARDFKADKRVWRFAKEGESIRVGELSGTVLEVDNEWCTDRRFDTNYTLMGLEQAAADARA